MRSTKTELGREGSWSSRYIPMKLWHRKVSLVFSLKNCQILELHMAEYKKLDRKFPVAKQILSAVFSARKNSSSRPQQGEAPW